MIPATRSIFDEKLENFELLAGTNCGNRLLSLMFAKTFYMEQAIEKPWFRGWVHPTWIPWMCMMCIPVPDWFMNMWITSNNPNKHGDEDSSININMTGLKKKWFDWKEATPSQPIWIIIPKKITMLVVDPIFRHQIPTLLIIYIYHCMSIVFPSITSYITSLYITGLQYIWINHTCNHTIPLNWI
jgi:hypothetical protein